MGKYVYTLSRNVETYFFTQQTNCLTHCRVNHHGIRTVFFAAPGSANQMLRQAHDTINLFHETAARIGKNSKARAKNKENLQRAK